jgi:hypothetical protein
MLPDDIDKYLQKKFPPELHEKVRELLLHSRMLDNKEISPRFLRCVLFNCKNDIASLKEQIKELSYDYRDVILAAEYIREQGEWLQVRDFSKPFMFDD